MKKGSMNEQLANWALGLNGEAGETAELIKKHVFHGHDLDYTEIIHELGDVFFYAVALCNTLGLSMDNVIETNVNKLTKRYPDGFDSEKSKNRDT